MAMRRLPITPSLRGCRARSEDREQGTKGKGPETNRGRDRMIAAPMLYGGFQVYFTVSAKVVVWVVAVMPLLD